MNNLPIKVVFYPCQEVEGRSAAAVTKPSGEKTTFTENNRGADQTKTTYIHDKGMMDEFYCIYLCVLRRSEIFQ